MNVNAHRKQNPRLTKYDIFNVYSLHFGRSVGRLAGTVRYTAFPNACTQSNCPFREASNVIMSMKMNGMNCSHSGAYQVGCLWFIAFSSIYSNCLSKLFKLITKWTLWISNRFGRVCTAKTFKAPNNMRLIVQIQLFVIFGRTSLESTKILRGFNSYLRNHLHSFCFAYQTEDICFSLTPFSIEIHKQFTISLTIWQPIFCFVFIVLPKSFVSRQRRNEPEHRHLYRFCFLNSTFFNTQNMNVESTFGFVLSLSLTFHLRLNNEKYTRKSVHAKEQSCLCYICFFFHWKFKLNSNWFNLDFYHWHLWRERERVNGARNKLVDR